MELGCEGKHGVAGAPRLTVAMRFQAAVLEGALHLLRAVSSCFRLFHAILNPQRAVGPKPGGSMI
eukprot:9736276-Alexandrium_andersonii.AAC.1